MPSKKKLSSCCNANCTIRRVSLTEGVIVFSCSRCRDLSTESIDAQKRKAPVLQLIRK